MCVGKLTIISSDNGLSPGRRQAIICTNAGILLIRPWGTNFSAICIGNKIFSFKKMHLKMSCVKWRPVYLGLNVLKPSLMEQIDQSHSVWTPFHSMYENSTLCTNWFVHQANTAGAFIVHQANAAGVFIVHQGNVVEHFGWYIKRNGVHPQWKCRQSIPLHLPQMTWWHKGPRHQQH